MTRLLVCTTRGANRRLWTTQVILLAVLIGAVPVVAQPTRWSLTFLHNH